MTRTSKRSGPFAIAPLSCAVCGDRVWTLTAVCGNCASYAADNAPGLEVVEPSEKLYRRIKTDFLATWQHPTATRPKITSIHAALLTSKVMRKYKNVRRDNESSKEMRLYHGTTASCDFDGEPCNKQSCSLCRILKSGFRHPKPSNIDALNSGAWDRFGSAIYMTPVSSKAADYEDQRNAARHGPYRVRHVILARMATGVVQELFDDDPRRKHASRGFDSVMGQPGYNLNYAEYATYQDRAAIPLFVIGFVGGL